MNSEIQRYHIEATYSPYDAGWYAEIYDNSGRTVAETIVYSRHDQMLESALDWIRKRREEESGPHGNV